MDYFVVSYCLDGSLCVCFCCLTSENRENGPIAGSRQHPPKKHIHMDFNDDGAFGWLFYVLLLSLLCIYDDFTSGSRFVWHFFSLFLSHLFV